MDAYHILTLNDHLTMQHISLSLKALKFLQKMVLNIVFPGGEHATNLIIANMEVLSHDNRNSHSFSLDGHKFGACIHR